MQRNKAKALVALHHHQVASLDHPLMAKFGSTARPAITEARRFADSRSHTKVVGCQTSYTDTDGERHTAYPRTIHKGKVIVVFYFHQPDGEEDEEPIFAPKT